MATNETAKPKDDGDRRIGSEDSETRSALLDAAQELMQVEGYAAVTSRRVAARAGVKQPLVYYYFRTMDDLFLALFRRGAEQNLERQARALDAAQPLHALWELTSEPTGAAVMMQFLALGTHRTVIRDAIADYAERFRTLQARALAEVLERNGVDQTDLPAVAVLIAMASVSRVLVMESELGITVGHAETLALTERLLSRFDPASS